MLHTNRARTACVHSGARRRRTDDALVWGCGSAAHLSGGHASVVIAARTRLGHLQFARERPQRGCPFSNLPRDALTRSEHQAAFNRHLGNLLNNRTTGATYRLMTIDKRKFRIFHANTLKTAQNLHYLYNIQPITSSQTN